MLPEPKLFALRDREGPRTEFGDVDVVRGASGRRRVRLVRTVEPSRALGRDRELLAGHRVGGNQPPHLARSEGPPISGPWCKPVLQTTATTGSGNATT